MIVVLTPDTALTHPAESQYNLFNIIFKRGGVFISKELFIVQFTVQGFCNASTSKTMYCIVVTKYDSACLYIVYIVKYLLVQQGERKKDY